ncbi:EpsG family protein [Soonwooa sp.]|uniref:EpsG family protein n=1 Tax=Soonwooa sp. TaxID=1938592 RepID=UPI0035B1C72E
MHLLHPYFLVAIVVMFVFSFQEVYSGRVNKKYFWYLGVYLMILAGFRDQVGADFGSYLGIYYWTSSKEYWSIFLKALTLEPPTPIELEWGYVFINKLVLEFNAPFYVLTTVVAILAISFKNKFILENTMYPFSFLLISFIPGFFVGESGQIRQNLGSFIAYFAIRYIKERNLLMYLLFIHLAGGVHSVCYVLLPMYWLARVPLNKLFMMLAIIGSIIASPFEVYRFFGSWLDSLMSDSTIVVGFNGYMSETIERQRGGFGYPELMMLIVTVFLFAFDTLMKKKYPYYEYHRWYALIAICSYFIFRNNPIFSSRLAGVFVGVSYLIIPNAMYVVNAGTKRIIHFFIICLAIFNFLVFSSFNNISKGKFTIEKYRNWILP